MQLHLEISPLLYMYFIATNAQQAASMLGESTTLASLVQLALGPYPHHPLAISVLQDTDIQVLTPQSV